MVYFVASWCCCLQRYSQILLVLLENPVWARAVQQLATWTPSPALCPWWAADGGLSSGGAPRPNCSPTGSLLLGVMSRSIPPTPLHPSRAVALVPILEHRCFLDLSPSCSRSRNGRKMDVRSKGHFLMDQVSGSAPRSAWQATQWVSERRWESWSAAAAKGGRRREEKKIKMASVSSTKPIEDFQGGDRKTFVTRVSKYSYLDIGKSACLQLQSQKYYLNYLTPKNKGHGEGKITSPYSCQASTPADSSLQKCYTTAVNSSVSLLPSHSIFSGPCCSPQPSLESWTNDRLCTSLWLRWFPYLSRLTYFKHLL